MNLVGTTGIAEMLGVSRQRANQIANTKGFPKRLDNPPLASGPVWKRDTVEKWAAKNGRTINKEEA